MLPEDKDCERELKALEQQAVMVQAAAVILLVMMMMISWVLRRKI